jgi:hypothetical protein
VVELFAGVGEVFAQTGEVLTHVGELFAHAGEVFAGRGEAFGDVGENADRPCDPSVYMGGRGYSGEDGALNVGRDPNTVRGEVSRTGQPPAGRERRSSQGDLDEFRGWPVPSMTIRQIALASESEAPIPLSSGYPFCD